MTYTTVVQAINALLKLRVSGMRLTGPNHDSDGNFCSLRANATDQELARAYFLRPRRCTSLYGFSPYREEGRL